MNRRKAREEAFLLLFEKSFNPETEIEDIIHSAVEQRFLEHDEYVFSIVPKTWDKLSEIDSVIEENLRGWKMNRISRVSLAALRLAISEILYEEDIPVGVSINEAVELCKKYAEAEDASFVNGVLSSVVKKNGTVE